MINISWMCGVARNINGLMLLSLIFWTTAFLCYFLLSLKYFDIFPFTYWALTTGTFELNNLTFTHLKSDNLSFFSVILLWFYVVIFLCYKSIIFYNAQDVETHIKNSELPKFDGSIRRTEIDI